MHNTQCIGPLAWSWSFGWRAEESRDPDGLWQSYYLYFYHTNTHTRFAEFDQPTHLYTIMAFRLQILFLYHDTAPKYLYLGKMNEKTANGCLCPNINVFVVASAEMSNVSATTHHRENFISIPLRYPIFSHKNPPQPLVMF